MTQTLLLGCVSKLGLSNGMKLPHWAGEFLTSKLSAPFQVSSPFSVNQTLIV